MRFAETATDNLYRLLRSGKVMWAASVLWTLTRENLYRDMALKAAGHIVHNGIKNGCNGGLRYIGQRDTGLGRRQVAAQGVHADLEYLVV